MNSLVQKYSKSSITSPLDRDVLDVHGKWDASLDLSFPNFDIPAAHNVSTCLWQEEYTAPLTCS